MDERVRQGLGELRLPQASRERVWQRLSPRLGRPRRRWRPAAALCAVAVFLLAAGGWTYFTPTAYLALEAGPGWELAVNRFDRVVSVRPLTPEGEDSAGTVGAPFAGVAQAVETLLGQGESQAPVNVTVAGENKHQCGALLRQAEQAAGESVSCHSATLEERQQAQEAGLPWGKYRMFVEIHALDETFTPQQAREMTMSQLRALLEELRPGDTSQKEGGHGQGHGHGQRQRGRGSWEEETEE